MQDSGDRPEPGFETTPAYPTTVTIAGTIWIGFGVSFLFNSFWAILDNLFDRDLWIFGVNFVSAAAFIFVGRQSVRGTARDTLGNSIGSFIFAFIFLLALRSDMLQAGGDLARIRGRSGISMRTVRVLQAGGALASTRLLALVGLFAAPAAAGVLALVGRSHYKTWRKARGG